MEEKILLSGCGWGLFRRGFVRFGLQLAVLSEENLNLPLRLLQLFAARNGELHTLFEEFQRLLERYIAFLELIHDSFETLKAILKFGHDRRDSKNRFYSLEQPAL